MVKFLKELEHTQLVACVQQICLLFEDILFEGSDVFESSVCLVCVIESKKGASCLAVNQNWNFQLPIVKELSEQDGVLQGWVFIHRKCSTRLW